MVDLDQVRQLGASPTNSSRCGLLFLLMRSGFSQTYVGDIQLLLTNPLCRRRPMPAQVKL
jgi:hypothetical protein